MSQVKGTIEAVSCKEGNEHPTYGKSWQTSIKVNDVWYGAFTKKDADGLGLKKGKLVTFTFSENGKYKNFDPKSLVVSESQAAPAPAAKQGSYSGSYGNGAGIKVGHAINNAVQLAIAKGDTSLKAIHGHAVDILALSVKLEGQFDKIIASADSVIQKAGANAGAPAAEAPAPAATGKTAAPKATRKKATPAAAPTPPPVQEPEPDEAPPVEAPAQAEPSFDDDDIPF